MGMLENDLEANPPKYNEQQLEFDCAAKAEREGQPKPFVLIASDPLAPWLVDMWASMRRGDTEGALGCFYGMVDSCITRYKDQPSQVEKVDSADRIAMNMRNYRIVNRLR